jgi:hypothetical protein
LRAQKKEFCENFTSVRDADCLLLQIILAQKKTAEQKPRNFILKVIRDYMAEILKNFQVGYRAAGQPEIERGFSRVILLDSFLRAMRGVKYPRQLAFELHQVLEFLILKAKAYELDNFVLLNKVAA